MDSKVAAKQRSPPKVPSGGEPELPQHFRSRSVGYRAKLAVDVKTDAFLMTKRNSAMETKDSAAQSMKRPMNIKGSQSSIMLRMGGGDVFNQQFLCARPRGRSCHGFKPYAEFPVFHQAQAGDTRRCIGNGDMAAAGDVKFLQFH